jgi:predicted amidophosphoribosyltransferase
MTVSLYEYSGPVRKAILAWKLEGRDEGVLWLLDAARLRLRELIHGHDVLLPIPMPLRRMRKTGQHHAAELCRNMASITGADWNWRILRRQGEQPRQSSLSGTERRRNLRRAFVINLKEWEKIPHRGRIWIVDDIRTTGATLEFAARSAKSLGQPVCAFSLARVAHNS